jgi:hypothetical protein
MTEGTLSMWTIYRKPADYPDGYVVREWIIGAAAEPVPGEGKRAVTLEKARELVPPGMYKLNRQDGDDPVIVETWV